MTPKKQLNELHDILFRSASIRACYYDAEEKKIVCEYRLEFEQLGAQNFYHDVILTIPYSNIEASLIGEISYPTRQQAIDILKETREDIDSIMTKEKKEQLEQKIQEMEELMGSDIEKINRGQSDGGE